MIKIKRWRTEKGQVGGFHYKGQQEGVILLWNRTVLYGGGGGYKNIYMGKICIELHTHTHTHTHTHIYMYIYIFIYNMKSLHYIP